MEKRLKVGELRRYLSDLPHDMEITFGSSKWSKRPLMFYRFKKRGENLLHIELNEIDKVSPPMSECEERETVGYFLEQLKPWDDGAEIIFGSTIDAVHLEFKSLSTVVAVNLVQPDTPKWISSDD